MPAVKFCASGDYQPAIAAARSRDYCRACYNSLILDAADDLIQFEVTNPTVKVTDTRTRVSHGAGAVITLDPRETNIAALVAGGAGRVVPPAKPGKADPVKG